METKHTPGPWEHKGNTVQSVGRHYSSTLVATTSMAPHFEHAEANARLIAAAPELFDALCELLTDMMIAQGNMRKAAKRDPAWEGCAEIIQPRVDAARAVIAKAEGK